jgi:aquaporin Z
MSKEQGIAMKKLAAEMFATFLLTFTPGLILILHDTASWPYQAVVWPVAYGLSLFVIMSVFGRISGAHVNPAISMGFWVARRFPSGALLPYILAQFIGAILAALCLLMIAGPGNSQFLIPTESRGFTLLGEAGLTFSVMLSLLSFCSDAFPRRISVALFVGTLVSLSFAFFPPLTIFLNPATWLTVSIISGNFENAWIYILGPCVGSLAAPHLCKAVAYPECCGKPDARITRF